MLCVNLRGGQKNYIFYKIEDPQGTKMRVADQGRALAHSSLMVSVRSKQIRGLWFHNDAERVKIENMLEQTMETLQSISKIQLLKHSPSFVLSASWDPSRLVWPLSPRFSVRHLLDKEEIRNKGMDVQPPTKQAGVACDTYGGRNLRVFRPRVTESVPGPASGGNPGSGPATTTR